MKVEFTDRQSYLQNALNDVARIISDHGQQVLECSVPAVETEKCLSHLALVATLWTYDSSLIEALADNYKIYNQEMLEYMEQY